MLSLSFFCLLVRAIDVYSLVLLFSVAEILTFTYLEGCSNIGNFAGQPNFASLSSMTQQPARYLRLNLLGCSQFTLEIADTNHVYFFLKDLSGPSIPHLLGS